MALNPRITDWRGQRVWLIGASSGIGRAVAEALHARGAQVCVSARQQAPLQAFVDAHPGSQALALDVTDATAVASAAPARPLLAILLPSMAVTMLAVSPGVLSRIDVVEPPYMAP